MKGKLLLLCGALATIVGTNSFAMEIYKGRVVKHKEWTTGNVKVAFKEGNLAKAKMLVKQQQQQQTQYMRIYAMTSTQNAEGIAGSPTTITGDHYIYLSNDTNSTQSYSYQLSICAATSDHQIQCGYYFDEIELEAGGYAYSTEEPTLIAQFNQAGSYETYSQAWVMSNYSENTPAYVNVASNSAGTINITDNAKTRA